MKNYIDQGIMKPITTHARDTTSYQIILKQLDRIGEKYNLDFKLEEVGSYYEGDDEMHTLIIYQKKNRNL